MITASEFRKAYSVAATRFFVIAMLLASRLAAADWRIRLPVEEGRDLLFKRIAFENITSHASVTQIIQDRTGFMWFGTTDGLKRYDGYRIREFRPEADDPASLSGLDIKSIFEDRSGKLWLACDLTADRYDPATESFTNFPASVLEGPVHHSAADRDGSILLSTAHGLERFDPATEEFMRYRRADAILRSTFMQRNGTLWVTDKEGIGIFNRQTGEIGNRILLRDPTSARRGRSANLSVAMIEDHAGVLWVASERDGLAKVDVENGRLVYFQLADSADEGVRAMLEDREGALWIGSNAAGLFKLDRDRKKLVRYRNRPGDPDSLSSDRVLALAEDRGRGMWAGAEGGGAVRFQRRSSAMHSYPLPAGGNSSVSAAFVDSRQNLWIGSRGLVHRIGRDSGQATFLLGGGGVSLAGSEVRSIAEDREGHIWIGVWGGGLHRYDPRTREWKIFRHDATNPFSLGHDSVFAVFVDRRGRVWAGTEDGLDLFDSKTGNFTVYRVEGIGANRERAIDEDAHGSLWLATLYTGLHRFDPDTAKFTVYRRRAQPGSLSSDTLTSVCVDRDGIVWAGTPVGLNRFDPATRKFTAFSERDGLAGNSITGILKDPSEGLWMTTNRGLSHFDVASRTFENYDSSDGLPSDLISAWPGGGGEMLVGSHAGLIGFGPPQAEPSTPPAPVVLTNFELSGAPVRVGAESPLKQSISQTRELTLSYRDRVFSLEFAALNFHNPYQVKYRYRLESFEHDWNEVEAARRVARYTSLGPGTYVFRVQSRTGREQWRAGASVTIRILPAWWASWWFRSTAVLAFAAVIWAVYRMRLRQVASRLNLRFEERLTERLRIAGDLHDTLLQDLLSASMHLDVAADILPHNSPVKGKLEHVLRLMSNAAENGRNAVHGLRSRDAGSLRLDHAFARIKQEFDGRKDEGPELRVFVKGRPRPLHPVFQDEVYCIGREALINAFRHAGAKNIEVELEYSDRRFKLAVCDDGRGIEPDVLQTGRAGHWGLTGMRERAQRIGAQLHVSTRQFGGTQVKISAPGNLAFCGEPESSDAVMSGLGLRRRVLRFLRLITRTG